MLKFVKENLFLPSLTRTGTAVGSWLVYQGVHETAANQIVLGGIAALLFAFDLGGSWIGRQLNKKASLNANL